MKKIENSKYQLKYDYYVTEDGRVYSDFMKKYLSTMLDKDGYVKVRLTSTDNRRHRYSIHRLVMENYCPVENMNSLQINHKDGNKQNNNLSNLEWCTCQENINHACVNGLRHNQKGENNNGHKYSEETILKVIDMLKSKKYTGKQIDDVFGFPSDYSNSIRRKERWAYLTENIDFN